MTPAEQWQHCNRDTGALALDTKVAATVVSLGVGAAGLYFTRGWLQLLSGAVLGIGALGLMKDTIDK